MTLFEGNRLRDLRLMRRLTVCEWGRRCGLSRDTIALVRFSHWLNSRAGSVCRWPALRRDGVGAMRGRRGLCKICTVAPRAHGRDSY